MAGEAQISQIPIEILVLPSTAVSFNISQNPVEILVLSSVPVAMQVSQMAVEILVLPLATVEKSYAYVDELWGM